MAIKLDKRIESDSMPPDTLGFIFSTLRDMVSAFNNVRSVRDAARGAEHGPGGGDRCGGGNFSKLRAS